MSQSTSSSNEPTGDLLPAVARAAIEAKVTRKKSTEPLPEAVEYLAEAHGVMITLFDKHGEEYACMGSTVPECDNIVKETVKSAKLLATKDPKLKKAKDRRLINSMRIEVAVLSQPQRVDSIIDLDPEIYGVILTAVKRGVSGIMLPHIKGLTTVDKQLAAIRRKASLRPDEHLKIERFRAEKFIEPAKSK